MEGIIGITILVGGIPTPLKNMKVNEKDDIPYIMEHKNQQTITVGGHALRFLLFACPSTFGPSQRLSSVTSPLATPFSSSKSLGVSKAHGEFDETRSPHFALSNGSNGRLLCKNLMIHQILDDFDVDFSIKRLVISDHMVSLPTNVFFGSSACPFRGSASPPAAWNPSKIPYNPPIRGHLRCRYSIYPWPLEKIEKKQLQSRFYLDLVGTFLIFLQVAIYIY